jgi:hypothetical protein
MGNSAQQRKEHMNTRDLLNINKIKEIENKAIKLASDNKLSKYKRKNTLDETNSRTIHTRMDKSYWRKYFKFERDLKKITKKNRQYKRCPKRYEVYLRSHWWEERKNKYYQKNGRKCAICGQTEYIHLHHIYYGDYGNEPDEQLVAFCKYHHDLFHKRYGTGTNDFRLQTSEFIIDEHELIEMNKLAKNL